MPLLEGETAVIDFDAIRDTLTPDQWWGIIHDPTGGLLPVCCGDIGHLRDMLTDAATSPATLHRKWLAVAEQFELLVGHFPDPTDPIAVFANTLIAQLDNNRPEWRAEIQQARVRDKLADLRSAMCAMALSAGGVTALTDAHGWIQILSSTDLLDLLRDPAAIAAVLVRHQTIVDDIATIDDTFTDNEDEDDPESEPDDGTDG